MSLKDLLCLREKMISSLESFDFDENERYRALLDINIYDCITAYADTNPAVEEYDEGKISLNQHALLSDVYGPMYNSYLEKHPPIRELLRWSDMWRELKKPDWKENITWVSTNYPNFLESAGFKGYHINMILQHPEWTNLSRWMVWNKDFVKSLGADLITETAYEDPSLRSLDTLVEVWESSKGFRISDQLRNQMFVTMMPVINYAQSQNNPAGQYQMLH